MHTKDLWFGIEREALSIVKQGRERVKELEMTVREREEERERGKERQGGRRRERERERVQEGEVEECRVEDWSCKDNIRWGMEN